MLSQRYTNVKKGSDAYGAYYSITNEDPCLVSTLMGHIAPRSAISVLGGGEQALFGMVSLGIETTGIDVEYGSIAASMMKGMLVERYGSAVKTLIRLGSEYFWDTVEREIVPVMPQKLGNNLRWVVENGVQWQFYDLERQWSAIPDELLEETQANMDKFSIVCSDITSVGGRYDAVYLSNILAWLRDDEKEAKILANIEKILEPGGHLIITSIRDGISKKNFNLLRTDNSRKDSAIQWLYHTYKFEPSRQDHILCI